MSKKKDTKIKISNLTFLLAILTLLLFLFLPGQNIYQVSLENSKPVAVGAHFVIPSPAPYPINTNGILPPSISAQGVLITDVVSQVVLYEKNSQMSLEPASTTKIMSALVALDYFKMDDILTVKEASVDGKIMNIFPGQKFTFENLLYGMLVDSANDAAMAIAGNYPGGLDSFVKKMNEKAKDLSLFKTHFTNPVGFEDNNHITTAVDLARLANFAMSDSTIARMVGTAGITVADAGFGHFYALQNVNELLGKVPGVLGIKTGWTENAGECLVTEVMKDNHKIMIVILGSQDRFGETKTLIDWVFNNFVWAATDSPKPD